MGTDLTLLGCGAFVLVVPLIFVMGVACFAGGICAGPERQAAQVRLEVVMIGAFFLTPVAYFVACWSGRGRTLGMKAVGLRLRRLDGARVGLPRAVVRSILLIPLVPGVASSCFVENRGWGGALQLAVPVVAVVLVATTLASRERRGLHDHVAGTIMVDETPDSAG